MSVLLWQDVGGIQRVYCCGRMWVVYSGCTAVAGCDDEEESGAAPRQPLHDDDRERLLLQQSAGREAGGEERASPAA